MTTTTTFTTITDDSLARITGGKDLGGADHDAGGAIAAAIGAIGSCPAPTQVPEPGRPGRASTGNVAI